MSTSTTIDPAITKLVEAITGTTADGRWIDIFTGKPGAGSDSTEAAPGRAIGRHRFAFVRAAVENFAAALQAPATASTPEPTETISPRSDAAGPLEEVSDKLWHAAVAREVAEDEVRTHAPRDTIDPRGRLLSVIARGGADTEDGFRKVFGGGYGLGWSFERVQIAMGRVWEASVAPVATVEPTPTSAEDVDGGAAAREAPNADEITAGTTVANLTRTLLQGGSVHRMFGGITKVHVGPGRSLGWVVSRTAAGGTTWGASLPAEAAAANYVAWCADAARWCAEVAEWGREASAKSNAEEPTDASAEAVPAVVTNWAWTGEPRSVADYIEEHFRGDFTIGEALPPVLLRLLADLRERRTATPTAAGLRSALVQARDWILDDVESARYAEAGDGRTLIAAIDALLGKGAPAPDEVVRLRETHQQALRVAADLTAALETERAAHAVEVAALEDFRQWGRARMSAAHAAAGDTPLSFALRQIRKTEPMERELFDAHGEVNRLRGELALELKMHARTAQRSPGERAVANTHRLRDLPAGHEATTSSMNVCLDCSATPDSIRARLCTAATSEAREAIGLLVAELEVHRDELDTNLVTAADEIAHLRSQRDYLQTRGTALVFRARAAEWQQKSLRDAVVVLLETLESCWRCPNPATKRYPPHDDVTCDGCDTGFKGRPLEQDLTYAAGLRAVQFALSSVTIVTTAEVESAEQGRLVDGEP